MDQNSILPPNPPIHYQMYGDNDNNSQMVGVWESVSVTTLHSHNQSPCPRSLHAAAIWGDKMLIFGGYDGSRRLNDFYAFQISQLKWSELAPRSPPAPRDRHSAVVYGHSFYVFGGFDGSSRVNDLHEYDLFLHKWRNIPSNGSEPSPRHSHSAVVYGSSMYIFAGYDGGYCNDLHQFHFQTKAWSPVICDGTLPRGRYRCSTVVYKDQLIIHGGHDGTCHLDDAHVYNFTTSTWSTLEMHGPMPHPRDSHCAIVFEHSMFIFGGSNGSPLDDFHELNLMNNTWKPILSSGHRDIKSQSSSLGGSSPSSPNRRRDMRFMPDEPIRRFCHTGVLYDDTMYIFGGYDGVSRLNDLKRYRFSKDTESFITVPPSTLQEDLRSLVNSDVISDVTFIVEGRPIRAHRILCLRSPFFRNMLTGEYLESRASEIVIPNISYETFLLILQYIYCDSCDGVTIDNAMDVFQAADRFNLERLKLYSESSVISSITVDTAATIYLAADLYHAENLKKRCLQYILKNFDSVSRTTGFEEMGRNNVDLDSEKSMTASLKLLKFGLNNYLGERVDNYGIGIPNLLNNRLFIFSHLPGSCKCYSNKNTLCI